MHGDDMVDVEIDQFLDSLPDVVLVVRRQMETSEHRVDLLQARHHRLLHRIHRPAMPARGEEWARQWRIVPAYPSNLFRAVQGRTLMFTLKAFIALVVTWCLLAVAAVVAASTQRFEGLYMYLVAAAVLVGLVIVGAIAIAP